MFLQILSKEMIIGIDEVLVVGDDLHSEIKAAQDLGIDAVVYDKYNLHPDEITLPKIDDFKQLEALFKQVHCNVLYALKLHCYISPLRTSICQLLHIHLL